jgi:hypothetical protein
MPVTEALVPRGVETATVIGVPGKVAPAVFAASPLATALVTESQMAETMGATMPSIVLATGISLAISSAAGRNLQTVLVPFCTLLTWIIHRVV